VKITAIRLDRMRLPLDPPFRAAWDPVPRRHFDATLVRVETDEGITGFGSGDTMDGFAAFVDLFIGRDPREIAHHVLTIETINFHAGRYWPLEAALWDIIGKAAGQPVSALFGAACTRLPAYASFGELKSPAERADAVLAARAAGFGAVKIRIDRADVAAGLAAVRAARTAAGDSIEIMVDLNQGWRMAGDISPALDVAAVRRLASELAELGVLWLEEPLPAGDLAGMRMLREQTGIRVAGGEMTRTPAELRARSTSCSPMPSWPSACSGHGPSPSSRSCGTAGSPRTPGRTGSACWPTCTWRPASAGDPTSSSPTTRPAGPSAGAISSWPSRCSSTPAGTSPCRDGPGSAWLLTNPR
jgi:L-alanine-DL-glutamate epimerase-like enolase superfamily enzyme